MRAVIDYLDHPVVDLSMVAIYSLLHLSMLFFSFSKCIREGIKGKPFIERRDTPLKDFYVGNAFVYNEHEKRNV